MFWQFRIYFGYILTCSGELNKVAEEEESIHHLPVHCLLGLLAMAFGSFFNGC